MPSQAHLVRLISTCLSFGSPSAKPLLPNGGIVRLGERGETFVREVPGPPDSIPVVLLHGWAMTADLNYIDVYAPLSAAHRVVAPDVRMHGRGPRGGGFTLTDAADDVIALLDTLDIDRAILCGFSMGGGIAADVVERYPDRVAGTVIAGTAACYTTRLRDRMIFAGLNALRPLVAIGINPPPGLLMAMLARGTSALGAQRARWLFREYSRTTLSDVLSVSEHMPAFDLRPRLAHGVERPCEFLVLARDHVCHPQLQRELAELLGAHVTTLDADHDLPITHPERYAESLVAAVGRLDRRLNSGQLIPARGATDEASGTGGRRSRAHDEAAG
ncbi:MULTISPECIES: alpha/beta hydrolase [unclassified Mycobacterium]|uniref:alpha/beta fold hydrolase n=1 Tax=unclassified Mycobacterium TaxID=2642494 RepID=UPI00089874D2|nr:MULTISPECIES: alpha/beta hydrolase [unclassified Mycobacterium]SEA61017.1 Pimeloyl-ACP methyl ester carboxylesterase [Mycobacterium sp. 283mftsu]